MGLALFDLCFDDAPTPAAFAARYGARLGWALSFALEPLPFALEPPGAASERPVPGPRDLQIRFTSPPPLVRAFDELCFGPRLIRLTGAIDHTSAWLQRAAVRAGMDLGGALDHPLGDDGSDLTAAAWLAQQPLWRRARLRRAGWPR